MAVWMMDDDVSGIMHRLLQNINLANFAYNYIENQQISADVKSKVQKIFTKCDKEYLKDENFVIALNTLAINLASYPQEIEIINHKSILDFLYEKTRDIDINYIGDIAIGVSSIDLYKKDNKIAIIQSSQGHFRCTGFELQNGKYKLKFSEDHNHFVESDGTCGSWALALGVDFLLNNLKNVESTDKAHIKAAKILDSCKENIRYDEKMEIFQYMKCKDLNTKNDIGALVYKGGKISGVETEKSGSSKYFNIGFGGNLYSDIDYDARQRGLKNFRLVTAIDRYNKIKDIPEYYHNYQSTLQKERRFRTTGKYASPTSDNDNAEFYKSDITDIIIELGKEFSPQDIIKTFKFANENEGVGNVKHSRDQVSSNMIKISAKFQRLAKKNKIYTGREFIKCSEDVRNEFKFLQESLSSQNKYRCGLRTKDISATFVEKTLKYYNEYNEALKGR